MYDPTMYDTGVHIQKSMLKLIEDCIIKDAEVQWAQGYYRKCYNKCMSRYLKEYKRIITKLVF